MKRFLHNRGLLALVTGGLILNACAWGIALLFPRNEAAAILHYTSSVGIGFVGEGRHIIVLPAAGLLILFLNAVVGRVVQDAESRTAWVLWSAIPIVQAIICVALLFLRSINR